MDRSCGAEWLFAFEKASEINHDNYYYSDYGPSSYEITKEATCTENGLRTYMPCLLCGEAVAEVIPAKGHTYQHADSDHTDHHPRESPGHPAFRRQHPPGIPILPRF